MAESEDKLDLEKCADNVEGARSSSRVESKTIDSDDVFEMFCETCMRDEIQITACAFCPSCVAYFCSSCVKNHGKFFRKHTCVQGDNMFSDICSEKCEIHKREIVKFYCETCDNFVCTICKEDIHTDSCSLKYLPDFLKNRKIENELKLLHSDQRVFTKKISEHEKAISSKHTHLSNICAETQRLIKKEKDKSFAKFDKEANQIENRIQTIKEDDSTLFDALKDTNESLSVEIDKLSMNIKILTTTSGKIKYKMFIDLKRLRGKVKKAETAGASVEGVAKPEPDLENQAKNISKKVEEFGTLIQNIQMKGPNEEERTAPRKIARTLNDICVRDINDEEDCSISDCCMVSTRYLVACDKANRSLKLIDIRQNKVAHVRSVDKVPETVTKINDREIATVQGRDRGIGSRIQFLSLTKSNKLIFQKRSIFTQMYCASVAYIRDDKLIVSMNSKNYGKVQILDMEGTILEDIDTNSDGDPIFKSPKCITVDYEAQYAYVSDWYKDQVFEIDLDTFNTRPVAYMWHPEGLTSDDEGFVYAIEYGSGKLFYFHPHHKYSKKVELLIDTPTHTKPFGICFCSVEKKLYFGQTVGDTIRVLKITDDK